LATVASFNVALVASTGRFVGAVSRAERQWNQFARSVQRGAKQLPEAIRAATPASLTLGRYVARFGAVAAAAFSAASIWGVRLASQFEQTRMAMATMLGSVEEADRFLKDLEKRARRTPFGFQQLVEMSRQMLAWGFAREEIEQMLDPIGDFVAAMGGGAETIDRVVRALGQIRARGKLASQEMLQLTEAGVPAWALLAKSIGVSIPEAMERVSRGTISSTTAIQAIIEGLAEDPRFAGAMERQARTILGQWEQVKDGITTIIRGIGEDIIKITNLGSAMRWLNETIGRFADLVSDKGFFNALREAFPPWLPPVIIGIAGAIAGGLVPVIVALLLPALKKLRASIAATGLALWKWMLAGAAVAVVAYLLARYWGHLGDVARAVWSAIGAAALYGASLVVRGIGLILAGIGVIIPAFRGVANSVLGLADSLKSSASGLWASARSSLAAANEAAKTQEDMAKSGENAAGAQNELEKAMKSAGKAANKTLMPFDEIHTMQTAMASSPAADLGDLGVPAIEAPQVVAPGIGGIGDIAVGVSDQLSKAAKTAGKAWDTLKQKMEPVNKVIQWIKDNWPTIGPIIENIASIIMVLLVPALIKSGTQAMIAAGKHVLAWTMKGAAALAKGAIIVGQLMLIIAKWAWAGIQALIHAGKIVLAWAMQGWAAVAQGAVMIGQFVLIIAKWAWAGAQALIHAAKMAAAWVVALGPVAWITAAVIALAVLIIAKWDWIKEKTTAIWAAVTKWLSDKWDSIKTKATNIFNTIKNSIINAFDSVKTRITTIWSNIWDTIRSFINKIIDGMNSMIRGMNRLKWDVPDWVPLIGGKKWGISIPLIPKLATGTNYVPRDMLAYLHRGEAVIPKEYNPAAVAGAGGGNAVDRLAKTIARALREAATSGSEQEGPFILQVNIGGNKVLEEIIEAARRKNAKAGRTVVQVGV